MIEIKRADCFDDHIRDAMSEVFVEGFGHWLVYFSKDSKKLEKALKHMFILDTFYLAMDGNEVCGMIACIQGKNLVVELKRKELVRHLGLIKGNLAAIFLKKEFEKPPVETGPRVANVGFVVTASKHRGKGIASKIMNHLFEMKEFDEYILEVADTNAAAMALYSKLGFKEFLRIPQKHADKSGVNALVYMKCVQSNKKRKDECKL